jgi:carbamoyltransferase
MPEAILGISAYYHDSAAALIIDGDITAAAQEERFTRVKHDASFPVNAIRYVLDESGLDLESLTAIAFYDKPFIKFERLLETYHAFVPKGLVSFSSAIPVWLKEKIFLKKNIRDELSGIGHKKASVKMLFPEHHLSHAASAFYPSPYDEAAILTIDGVGEWATATIGHGKANRITVLKELTFPHSPGLLYAAFTYYLGFKINSGEYKLMGLAPYGNPRSGQTQKFVEIIKNQLVDIREDGSILLNMRNFRFATGLRMVEDRKWSEIFNLERRKPGERISSGHMNLALAIQMVLEEIIFRLAQTAGNLTGSENLVMAGGVALNSVANGKILDSGMFRNIWVQPAATDAGGAVGAALASWHIWHKKPRQPDTSVDSMKGALLGPEFTDSEIIRSVIKTGAVYTRYDDFNTLCRDVASQIAEGKVAGWFQGRMEFGPRALGNRSILADARNPEMQKKLNLKIKKREGFRPFAPSVLEEDSPSYFKTAIPSPYMLFVVPVQEKIRLDIPEDYDSLDLKEKLYIQRSVIPAVTHVDFSARLQTVNKETNPRFYQLLSAFRELTGTGLIINTSFNVRGEPIVCTPPDAYRCFMNTEMDILVMGNLLFRKEEQPEMTVSVEFEPD